VIGHFPEEPMMEHADIYQDLAHHLDSFPQGFPGTNSGKELELLAHLFTPEEAQFALTLSLFYKPVDEVGASSGFSRSECLALIKAMVNKGLVNMRRGPEGIEVSLLPFVVGFYERQVFRMDETFARLSEDYFHEGLRDVLEVEPQFHRVIPINASIDFSVEILPEEDVNTLLSSKKAWAVFDCVCRKQQVLLGQACEHPLKVCMAMSDQPGAFDNALGMEALDLVSAVQVLDFAAQSGLVHTVSNQKDEISYICNCCTCGCGLLRGIAEAHMANVVARSSYYALVDQDLCIGCRDCEPMCQFDAITIHQLAEINRNACTGCGVCTRVCPEAAITLVRRPLEEIKPIPDSTQDWLEQRSQARGLNGE
jgi:Na+-translocating ferredoxin:NAD+ oxidoreductase subunit B